jgi:predicted N-acetyltransferase YhbS
LAGDSKYIVKPLGHEDRSAFHCGDPELDSYFHERASRDMREKLAAVFILVRETDPGAILGYYTLSAQQVDAGELPEELKKRTGKYRRIGVTLLGRLAVATMHQGKQLGAFLLVDGLRRSLAGTQNVMSFAVVVDAKSEAVVKFYEKFGFIRLTGGRLMMAMKTIEKNFQLKST